MLSWLNPRKAASFYKLPHSPLAGEYLQYNCLLICEVDRVAASQHACHVSIGGWKQAIALPLGYRIYGMCGNGHQDSARLSVRQKYWLEHYPCNVDQSQTIEFASVAQTQSF